MRLGRCVVCIYPYVCDGEVRVSVGGLGLIYCYGGVDCFSGLD